MGERLNRRRVGIFGWGVVAPKSPHIEAFEKNLASTESWLSPFEGFGPSNFLVGQPEFHLPDYKAWVDERFPPTRFVQLEKKMGQPAQYAIGAFIQSLRQNPGMEQVLQELGQQAHVYVGTGLGDVPLISQAALAQHRAQRRWNRFWADPERNAELRQYLSTPARERRTGPDVPPAPDEVPAAEREDAEERWWSYWTSRSRELKAYLRELAEIESAGVEGPVDTAKLSLIKDKRQKVAKLQKQWNAPEPPWNEVPAALLWNIPNAAAAQISMLGRITGPAFAPVAACSSFGLALRLAMDAIRSGEAKAVVVGMTDPPPHPLTVGAFYQARVLAADGRVSKPLTGLRGTHVSGGAVVWIVGDLEYMAGRGFKPLGMEPLAVGLSSDAEHIITPSKEGPLAAIRQALTDAGVEPEEIGSWDLHATATPGDYQEVENLRRILPQSVLVTARKGTFGHGMSAAGGWELTAQYLGFQAGRLSPTPLTRAEVHPEVQGLHQRFLFDASCPAPRGLAGKLSMGVGGINACVLSRPLER